MDQIKNVIIYGRSIPENLKDVAMGESVSLPLISLFSIVVTQRGVVTQTIPVRISHVLIVKISGNRPHTFRMILLNSPFDRSREYC